MPRASFLTAAHFLDTFHLPTTMRTIYAIFIFHFIRTPARLMMGLPQQGFICAAFYFDAIGAPSIYDAASTDAREIITTPASLMMPMLMRAAPRALMAATL